MMYAHTILTSKGETPWTDPIKDDAVNPPCSHNKSPSKSRILLADDDAAMRALLMLALQTEGYEVSACADGVQLLKRLQGMETADRQQRFDLIICDMRMPGLSGLKVLERLRVRRDVPPTILITAFGDEQTHLRARQLGATASVDKPFDITWFVELVHELLANSPPRSGIE
jgi:CheY-like chemotaxis protein